MFWGELSIVLGCIFLGARLGGVGIGLAGELGIVILVFFFGLQPTSAPVDVILIIVAIITLVSTLHAAGGLDFLVTLAERILRRHPSRITLIAPVVTYLFSVFCGTAYVSYALYPVIVEVAYGAKVRPERPLSIATVAASQAITASPLSAAMAVLVSLVSPHGISIGQIVLVCIPAGLIGVLMGALVVYRRGVELEDDPEYKRRLAAGEIHPPKIVQLKEVTRSAKWSVLFFALAVASMITLGSSPTLMPSWTVDGKLTKLPIPQALEMIMLCAAAICVVLLRIQPSKIIHSSIFTSGMMAVVSILGIAWMVDTFFHANQVLITTAIGDFVRHYPQFFAVALLATAALMTSQGAAIRAIGPLGMALGVSAGHMVAFFHAASAVTVIPATGSVIGATALDRTGTTKIGKFVFNHSFLLPGIVCNVSSVVAAYIFASAVF